MGFPVSVAVIVTELEKSHRLPLKLLTNTTRWRIYPSFPRGEKELAALTLPSDVSATHVRLTQLCGDECLRQCVCVCVCEAMCDFSRACEPASRWLVAWRIADWSKRRGSRRRFVSAALFSAHWRPVIICFKCAVAPKRYDAATREIFYSLCCCVTVVGKTLPQKKKMHCGQ